MSPSSLHLGVSRNDALFYDDLYPINRGITLYHAGTLITSSNVLNVTGTGGANSSATFEAFIPEGLLNYVWTCTATPGSSCQAPNGNGPIIAGVSVAAGGQVSYSIRASLAAGEGSVIRNTVRIVPVGNPPDSNASNNSATDTDIVAVFANGFEG